MGAGNMGIFFNDLSNGNSTLRCNLLFFTDTSGISAIFVTYSKSLLDGVGVYTFCFDLFKTSIGPQRKVMKMNSLNLNKMWVWHHSF